MKFAVVYDSRRKLIRRVRNTKSAAEQMARIIEAAGHEVYLTAVQDANVEKVRECDAICIGSWTQGLFFILQHATHKTMKFIDALGPLKNQHACVFCTFKTSYGKMLHSMTAALRRSGAVVNAHFSARGPQADPGFGNWVESLSPKTPSE